MLARKLYDYQEYDYESYANHSYERVRQEEHAAVAQPAAQTCDTALRRRVAALVLMTLLFAFCMVMRSDVFIQNGYELTELKSQETKLLKNIEHLQVTLAQSRSPERITALAGAIGMVAADSNLYVRAEGLGQGKRADDGGKREIIKEIAAVWQSK
jgi:cell division protein FtsL